MPKSSAANCPVERMSRSTRGVTPSPSAVVCFFFTRRQVVITRQGARQVVCEVLRSERTHARTHACAGGRQPSNVPSCHDIKYRPGNCRTYHPINFGRQLCRCRFRGFFARRRVRAFAERRLWRCHAVPGRNNDRLLVHSMNCRFVGILSRLSGNREAIGSREFARSVCGR